MADFRATALGQISDESAISGRADVLGSADETSASRMGALREDSGPRVYAPGERPSDWSGKSFLRVGRLFPVGEKLVPAPEGFSASGEELIPSTEGFSKSGEKLASFVESFSTWPEKLVPAKEGFSRSPEKPIRLVESFSGLKEEPCRHRATPWRDVGKLQSTV